MRTVPDTYYKLVHAAPTGITTTVDETKFEMRTVQNMKILSNKIIEY